MYQGKLSVFFPAFNEEENIAKTLNDADQVLSKLKLSDYELIVVDDGSKDKTADIVNKLIKSNPHIKLVQHNPNRGYGAALKTGFEAAKFPWVAFVDSDGQFDFNEIRLFLDYTDKADLILGYRLKRADALIRTLGSAFWKMGASIILGLNVRDYSCGFKLIKKEVYDALQPLVGEEKVTQIEMLVKSRRKKFKIVEIGVHHYPRQFGSQTGANMKVVLKSYLDLIKLWWLLR